MPRNSRTVSGSSSTCSQVSRVGSSKTCTYNIFRGRQTGRQSHAQYPLQSLAPGLGVWRVLHSNSFLPRYCLDCQPVVLLCWGAPVAGRPTGLPSSLCWVGNGVDMLTRKPEGHLSKECLEPSRHSAPAVPRDSTFPTDCPRFRSKRQVSHSRMPRHLYQKSRHSAL